MNVVKKSGAGLKVEINPRIKIGKCRRVCFTAAERRVDLKHIIAAAVLHGTVANNDVIAKSINDSATVC